MRTTLAEFGYPVLILCSQRLLVDEGIIRSVVPSDICDNRQFWLSSLEVFVFMLQDFFWGFLSLEFDNN